jgi:hypothetical protein
VHIFYGGSSTSPGIRVGTPGSATYNQVIKLGSRLHGTFVGAPAHPGDLFGWALATGDFNNDGFADLAIGIPGYPIAGRPDAGAVLILYGSKTGITAPMVTPGTSVGGRGLFENGTGDAAAKRGDFFGAALATGDFNASTSKDKPVADDLAVGIPGKDIGRAADAGAVQVFYGAQGGGQFFSENTPFMPGGGAATGDRFGCALAAGNFDNDAANDTDLAIGVPGKNVGGAADAGAVVTIYNSKGLTTAAAPEDCSTADQPPAGTTGVVVHHSSAKKLTSSDCWTDPQFWTENAGGIPGVSKAGDEFGGSLYSADLNGDGPADLVVGVPNEKLYGQDGAGSIRVMFGWDKFGLTDFHAMAFAERPNDMCTADDAENVGACASSPEYTEVGMVINKGDHFGQSLAVGDFDGDGSPDIVVGAPGKSVGAVADYTLQDVLGYPPQGIDSSDGAGVIQMIYGKATTDAATGQTTVAVGGGGSDVLYRQQGGLRGSVVDRLAAAGGESNGNGVTDTLADDGGGTAGTPGGGGAVGDPGLAATDGGPSSSTSLVGDHLGGALG